MASTPYLRNDSVPSRATSNPTPAQNTSLAEQGARLVAEGVAKLRVAGNQPVRIVFPRHLYVEPANLEKLLADDPLVGTNGAAIILGLSCELLKKWRRRGVGPEFYQYGEGGPVLYSVRALNAFKAAHLVLPGRKGRK